MRHPLSILGLMLVSACGGAAVDAGTPPAVPPSAQPIATPAAPRSLDEALSAEGLVRLEPAVVSREMTFRDTSGPRVEGRRITLHVSAGWNGQVPVFARRDDGTAYLIEARPETIVDRHVEGGCLPFAGGRTWSEIVVYELPEGTRYAGTLPVRWEEHVEVVDYRDTQPDGSPCPPPAID
jgi:hypothetical protein